MKTIAIPRRTTGLKQPVMLAVLAGILLTLAFPRMQWWPLVFVGLAPLALALEDRSLKASFGLGYLAGLVHAVTLVYWLLSTLMTFGHLPVWVAAPVFLLLVGYMALYPGLFGLGLALGRRYGFLRSGSFIWILGGAALFTGLEHFKGFFLTGFPWEPLGAALAPSLPMVQLSDILGTGGLTFLVVLVSLSLAALVLRTRSGRKERLWPPAVLIILVLALMGGYGAYRLPGVEAVTAASEERRAAVVQGSIDQALKWDPKFRVDTMMIYRDLTMEAAGEHPWITVWPETAAPFWYPQDEAAAEWLDGLVKRTGAPLLFGAPAYEETGPDTFYYNRANLLDAGGKPVGHYDKVHLVPYGEYIPLKRFFPFLGKITESVGDYSAGRTDRLLELDGRRIGVLICFESIFPALARIQAAAGADFLVVLTNDAWFGRSSAPFQHYAQAVMRAVETRRSVVRAANTGISGIILPTGRSVAELGLFERDVLSGNVPMMKIKTIYTVVGDVVPWLCLAATGLIFGVGLYRRRKNAE